MSVRVYSSNINTNVYDLISFYYIRAQINNGCGGKIPYVIVFIKPISLSYSIITITVKINTETLRNWQNMESKQYRKRRNDKQERKKKDEK